MNRNKENDLNNNELNSIKNENDLYSEYGQKDEKLNRNKENDFYNEDEQILLSSISSIRKCTSDNILTNNEDNLLTSSQFNDFKKIYVMNNMFYGCESLITLPDISKWNTSNVTKMTNMFYGCKSLKSLPDISKWNTSNVNDMSYIFVGCNSLIALPDI